MRDFLIITITLWGLVSGRDFTVYGQNSQTGTNSWSLEKCIEYALENNIQVRRNILTNRSSEIQIDQARSQRLPSVDASINQGFNWNKSNGNTGSGGFTGSSNTNFSVNSNIILYDGMRLNHRIEQAGLNLMSGVYNTEAIRESISINILNAFLQVLFAKEQVRNSEEQLSATTEQLRLTEERLLLGIVSRYEYQAVRSQLANEKHTLIVANNQLSISKVNLMQLMELPMEVGLDVRQPDIESFVNLQLIPAPGEVYQVAIGIRPQVKSAGYSTESARLDETIARADYLPRLTSSAGIGTGFSSTGELGYLYQLDNRLNPSVGFTLSIPIFQKNLVRSNIQIAQVGIEYAELEEINVRNQLRKDIEQACVDVISFQAEYDAAEERLVSMEESFALAEEKFNQGMINSVDYLFEKTNLTLAESQLLQSKYNLIFSYKILDFYRGVDITL